MLPPLFPGESPKLEFESANAELLGSESDENPVPRVRFLSSMHAGFWITSAAIATVFGVVAFLAIGIVTSNPSSSIANSSSSQNPNIGSVYGAWTDLPQTVSDDVDTAFNATSLQTKIASIINQQSNHTFGVVVAPVGAGDQVRLNDDHVFAGASTTKLLTAVAILAGIDSGKWKLEQTAYEIYPPTPSPTTTSTPEPKSSPTPSASPTPTPEPKLVTVEQALKLMINRSDNTSWERLIAMVGSKNLRQFAYDLGMKDYDVNNNRVSARDMALLLQKIYSSNVMSDASRSLLLANMQNTNEERMIPAAITQRGQVYHKYGWLGSVVHDVGIVDNYGQPIVLVLMSEGGSSYDNRTSVLRQLAEAVEQVLLENK